MIGSKQIVIDAMDVATRGMSTTPESTDGAFSPETTAINLLYEPGAMHIPAALTDKSTNLTGEAIGYTSTNVSNKNGFIIASDGKVMSIDSSQVLTASTALGGTYTTGTTDIINFIDKIYITSANDVARINTDLSGGDATWWSSTLSKGTLATGARHPMVVFQDRLWFGSLNSLSNIIDSSTGNKDVLLLNTHWEITALGVDPSSGKMLIACTQGANYSGTIASRNVVFSYDGTSATYTREYPVSGMVTGFRDVGGVTYVAYGANKIGYWNGAGITFMRQLRNATLAGADIPYKHHLSNIDNTLYVVDGTQILAYGEIFPGRKIWYYALSNTVNSNKFSLVCPVGSKLLGVGFATTKFYTFDTVGVGTGTTGFSFYTNKSLFTLPIFLREVRVFTTPIATTGSTILTIGGSDENGAGLQISFANRIRSLTAGTAMISFLYGGQKLNGFQLNMTPSNDTYGIKRIVTYYDPAE